MLYRVAGKLADNRPFVSRIEAPNALQAAGTARNALNSAGVQDDQVVELRVRAVKGGKSVRIGEAPDPNAPKKTRKPKVAPAQASASKK